MDKELLYQKTLNYFLKMKFTFLSNGEITAIYEADSKDALKDRFTADALIELVQLPDAAVEGQLYDGTNLTKEPTLRSRFQRSIGEQNIERKLDKLATNPKALQSLAEMQKDIADGNRHKYETKDYWHNMEIGRIIDSARLIAWARMQSDPDVVSGRETQLKAKLERQLKTEKTRYFTEVEPLLKMYK